MRLCIAIPFCLVVQAGAALSDGRVALLIGNEDYANPAFALRNPGNDVRAVEATLVDLGFEVRAEVDISRQGMLDAFDWLQASAEEADIAMVFFAGHAVQVGSENFLIGADLAELSTDALVESSVTLSEVLGAVESTGADLSLVVLDACRDNPFGTADIGAAGLSPVSGDVGTLVAYATDPGNVAADGAGDNSTFTSALINHIATPAIDVRLMFGRVRQEVVGRTNGLQVPWVEEAVLGEHYFADPPGPLDPDDELRVWREAVAAGGVASYEGYLDRFPEGLYAIVARLRIDALQGEAPEPADLDPNTLLPAAAALELAGYIVPQADYPGDDEIRSAYASWQAAQPAGARGFDALMGEAARTASFLGTYTAGILRNDLQRFASVDRALQTAENSLRSAETDFADDPDAAPVLQSMREEVAEIAEIKGRVAADLDASRTYYSDLIEHADRYLADWMTATAQPRFATSRGISRMSNRALSDAQTFYNHLALAREAPDGSYTWLAAMMEGL